MVQMVATQDAAQMKAMEDKIKAEIFALKRLQAEKSLAEFTKQAWHLIEPETKLVWNWHIDVICAYLEATVADTKEGIPKITRLIINVPPGSLKSILVSVMFPAWLWIKYPGKRVLGVANTQDLAIRDARKSKIIVTSEWYQERWPLELRADQAAKTNYENEAAGFRGSLGLTGNITGRRGDYVLLDDPHDATTVQSDQQRTSVLETYDSKISTRVNSQDKSVFIIIMQRLHHLDLTGHLLNKTKTKWVHAVIPMHYDPAFTYDAIRDLGRPDLQDPRKEDELMFPEVFSADVVEKLYEDMGEYHCTPAETPILMADLTYKNISDIKPGDVVLGWEKNTKVEGGRNCLVDSVVTETHVYKGQDIYEYTLENGDTVRCTSDHKWYARDRKDGNNYTPIKVGKSKLAKICTGELPKLSKEDERLAGWLAGFFDADGSCSLNKNNSDFRASVQIKFYQGYGRNADMCHKLERALLHFGFTFTYHFDERKDTTTGANFEYRCYCVQNKSFGTAFQTLQNFINIVQPTKWRDRIILGAKMIKFIESRNRVIDKSFLRNDNVYALTTQTGNYVAWGYASSNSAGQLEQRPSPKSGGILRSEWFRILPDDAPVPTVDHVFCSWDTAYSERDMTNNSYSACTTWGVFWNPAQERDCMLLLDVWFDRVDYPDLRRKAGDLDKVKQPDLHLIEKKASGLALVQDLKRSGLLVRTYVPTTDKVSRAYAIQAMLESGQVWIPNRKWALHFAYLMGAFPNGPNESEDLADTFTQAALYIRNGLYVSHPDDVVGSLSRQPALAAYGARSPDVALSSSQADDKDSFID